MHPPYDRLELLAAGGTSEDYATQETPASAAAHVIDVRGLHAGGGWPD